MRYFVKYTWKIKYHHLIPKCINYSLSLPVVLSFHTIVLWFHFPAIKQSKWSNKWKWRKIKYRIKNWTELKEMQIHSCRNNNVDDARNLSSIATCWLLFVALPSDDSASSATATALTATISIEKATNSDDDDSARIDLLLLTRSTVRFSYLLTRSSLLILLPSSVKVSSAPFW